MLHEYYELVCKEKNWNVRKLIYEGLKEMEELLSKNISVILFLELPTGYGKSTVTEALTRAAIDENNEYFNRVIHVLPMRSICDDLEIRLKKDKIIEKFVAAQHMHMPGSPFFAKRCVITTLDTFLLNLFKLPAIEFYKAFKYYSAHYEFPRSNIYTSIVIFDEFHLFAELGSRENEMKNLAACIAAIKCLAEKRVPVIIMTATLPSVIENEIISRLKEYQSIEKIYLKGLDILYEEEVKNKKKILRVEENKSIKDIVKENETKSILIILNTVKRAIEVYNKLRDYNPIILHGRIPELYRKKIVDQILNNQPKLLISTQVLEAGVDLSYDVLITEACPIDRLIQRSGRVARKENHDIGEIIVIKEDESLPYDKEITERTYNKLKEQPLELSYETSKDLIDNIYSEFYNDLKLDPQFIHDLTVLDYPIFSQNDAKKVYTAYEGFTSNFGIIACYLYDEKEEKVNKNLAIPLDNKLAYKLLMQHKKVVKDDFTKYDLKDEDLKEFGYSRENLPLSFLYRGYLGIAIPQDVYNELSGGIKYE